MYYIAQFCDVHVCVGLMNTELDDIRRVAPFRSGSFFSGFSKKLGRKRE